MLELGKQSGLLDETAETCFKCGLMLSGPYRDRLVAAPHGVRGGQVLFYCDATLERMVEREVDNAKAAFSQDALDFKLG
jgi:hypothetical protein